MWDDFLHRVRAIFRRSAVERELDDELRFHLDQQIEKYVKAGLSREEAARRARLEFGGLEQTKEEYRDSLGISFLETTAQDLRYAVRTMRRSPGFTTVAVLLLALGIGANTAIFSMIDALMLRWLPVQNPQELVQVKLGDSGIDALSYPIIRALAERRDIFSGVAGFSSSSFNVGDPGSIVKVPGALVSGGYYETFGLTPVAGRLIERADDEPGAPPVAVLSYGYWENQYGHREDIPGRTILVNGVPVTVIGVSSPGFVGADVGSIADITMPLASLPQISPASADLLGAGNFWPRAIARPSAGVSIPQATTRLASIWPQISEQLVPAYWPAAQRKSLMSAVFRLSPAGSGYTILREMYKKPLFVLMAVVGLVLAIACANVASLLLARATARKREIAVRLAIGAGRARIAQQFLAESMLLSLIGACGGIALAWISGRFLIRIISTGTFKVSFDLTPNWHILGFTALVAIGTSVLSGLAPVFQSAEWGPASALKDDARSGRSRSRLLSSLVVVEVSLSLVLLIAAGLFVRTLMNLEALDPGFKRDGISLVDFEGRRTALPQDLQSEIQRIPGVISASVSTHTPLSRAIWSEPAVPAGQPLPERDNAFFVGAGPAFFKTMGISVLSGREFDDQDSLNHPAVAVINEEFARRHFLNRNPIGEHLSAKVRGHLRELEIIGLVKNTNSRALRASPPPTVYVSYAQLPGDFPTTLEVRTNGATGQMSASIRKVLESRLPNDAIDIHSLSEQVEATMVQERMMATLAGGFGVLALILACVGLYGLLSYGVEQRTKEIGIRMALGAQRWNLILSVLGGAVRLVAVGSLLGLPAVWGASRWIASMLFNVRPTDSPTIAGSILLLLVSAVVAAFLPAWRASRVDPMNAIRHD
jgi:predicted permease